MYITPQKKNLFCYFFRNVWLSQKNDGGNQTSYVASQHLYTCIQKWQMVTRVNQPKRKKKIFCNFEKKGLNYLWPKLHFSSIYLAVFSMYLDTFSLHFDKILTEIRYHTNILISQRWENSNWNKAKPKCAKCIFPKKIPLCNLVIWGNCTFSSSLLNV